MSGATPGPWTKHPYSSERHTIPYESGDFDVADVYFGTGEKIIGSVRLQVGGAFGGYPHVTDDEELAANAALCMAAPDLLEALQGLLEVHDALGAGTSHSACKARAAIARAKGEAL